MKRFIYYLLLIIALCFVSETKAQNNYVKVDFGSDMNIDNNLSNINNSLSFEYGYFLTKNVALGLEYSYGFKKDDYGYFDYNSHRFGLQSIYEIDIYPYACPYFKLGVGYRIYDTDYEYFEQIDCLDFKLGIGINAYVSDCVAIVFGVDISFVHWLDTYDCLGDFHVNKDASILTPNIGLSYNF